MLGWIMIVASVLIMVRVAEAEDRSTVLWGVLTLLLCIATAMLIPLPFINIFLGLAVSFGAMFVLNSGQGSC